MTRNFSNQRRDGMHPSSRNSAASGKYREEQSSRPARPRLSRDAVDRAWENGATRTYADYRPRQNPPTSPAQRQGRPAPAYEKSRQPQNRRPYEASQESYGTPRTSERYDRYQQRPQQDDRQRRFDRPGYRPASQPGFNSEHWARNNTPQQPGGSPERFEDSRPPRFQQDNANYRGPQQPARFQQNNDNYRGPQRPQRFQQDSPNYRGPQRFQQDNPNYRGPQRFQQDNPNYRGPQRPRPFERNDREQFTRGPRGGSPAPQRDNYNPRWQSRPGPQRDYANQQRDYANQRDYPASGSDYTPQRPGRAQFEGDYERFNDYERPNVPQPTEQPAPAYERPVTRLPDGRVLKGSRPAQRKQARFWNDVEGQTSELLSQIADEPQEGSAEPLPHDPASTPAAPARKPARPKKPGESRIRKVKTVKTTHAEESKSRTAKVARKNTQGPRKQTTRPSQRGYQWPTT
ncbi:MAG TPA: hypothetical protein VF458_13695, partial [Ktedonobacteraceae bacterium]